MTTLNSENEPFIKLRLHQKAMLIFKTSRIFFFYSKHDFHVKFWSVKLYLNIYDGHYTGQNQSEAPVMQNHLTLTEWNRLVQNIIQNVLSLCKKWRRTGLLTDYKICCVQKEILEEVVRELQKVKEEIIDGKFWGNSEMHDHLKQMCTYLFSFSEYLHVFLFLLAIRRELLRIGST